MLPKEHPEQNSWSRRCLVLGVWVVRKCGKAKGNIYIYIYIIILVCSLNIYMILSFFFFFLLGAWCLGVEKMWESKGK